jgi:hypothetical protein
VAVPALKMIHVKDVQKIHHHHKSLNKCTIRVHTFFTLQLVEMLFIILRCYT